MAGNMRRRILMLLRVFEEEMDDKHTLTMSEILKMLECRGIAADRRAIYEDIEELNNMGYEIIRASDGKRGYFLVSRIGVIKPPVQLGVGEKGLEKKTSYAILKVVWQPQKVSKEASS